MSMGLINAHSVRNKTTALVDQIMDHDLDFIAFTETWLRTTAEDGDAIRSLTPAGYSFSHIPRTGPSRGGGVAILHKSNIKISSTSTWKAKSLESMIATLNASCASVKLVVIYRPPASKKNRSTLTQFRREFQDFLQDHLLRSDNIIVVGDFNIHVDVINTETERFSDILTTLNLHQHVTGPAHMDGHTLDLIITRSEDELVTECTVSEFLSDHAAVHCTLHLEKPKPLRQTIQFRKYKNIEQNSFKTDIQTSALVSEPDKSSSELFCQYNTIMSALPHTHAPVLTRTVTVRTKVPWINAGSTGTSRRQIRRGDSLIENGGRLNSPFIVFKEQRQEVSRLI